jgi:hypothetical protein
MSENTTTQKDFSYLPFSFTFYSNDNIVCKRYFNVDNYDKSYFNKRDSSNHMMIDSKKIDTHITWSYKIKDLMDELTGMHNGYGKMGIIPTFLKNICEDISWNNYNPHNPYNVLDIKNINETENNYVLEISFYETVIAKSTFTGNVFQPYARKGLHLGKIIPQIISTITNTFGNRRVKTEEKTV